MKIMHSAINLFMCIVQYLMAYFDVVQETVLTNKYVNEIVLSATELYLALLRIFYS